MNYCAGLVVPGCTNLAEHYGGTQCRRCAQRKYWLKNKEASKKKCSLYYWNNREKERARRKKYYQEHRAEEILCATVRRIRREKKANGESK